MLAGAKNAARVLSCGCQKKCGGRETHIYSLVVLEVRSLKSLSWAEVNRLAEPVPSFRRLGRFWFPAFSGSRGPLHLLAGGRSLNRSRLPLLSAHLLHPPSAFLPPSCKDTYLWTHLGNRG